MSFINLNRRRVIDGTLETTKGRKFSINYDKGEIMIYEEVDPESALFGSPYKQHICLKIEDFEKLIQTIRILEEVE